MGYCRKKTIILFVKFNFNMVTFSFNLKRFRKKATSRSREKGYKILNDIKIRKPTPGNGSGI